MADCNARFACENSLKSYLRHDVDGQSAHCAADLAVAHEKLSDSEQIKTSITSLPLG